MTTIIVLVAAAIAAVAGFFVYWGAHARRFVESGYTPPATSWFGELSFAIFAYLLTFLTVGKIKVKGKAPRSGRLIFAANHQLPCDFAMLRRGAGRHFRMLTASEQLGGVFGLLSAAGGVISVAFKDKADGKKAQDACVRWVASRHLRIPLALASCFWLASIVGFGYALSSGSFYLGLASVVAALVVAGFAGSPVALGIFPQGSLLPDDPDFKEHFRPGVVRIAREAAALSGEPVFIVPMAIYYERDAGKADWTHSHLRKMRSLFLGQRNPKVWNPIFKRDISKLRSLDQDAIKNERREIMRAYARSNVTNYGGTVVVGKPISTADLPEDDLAAVAVVRAAIVALVEEAKNS